MTYVTQVQLNGEWVNLGQVATREILVCDAGCGEPLIPGEQLALQVRSARGRTHHDPGQLFQVHEDHVPMLLDRIAPR